MARDEDTESAMVTGAPPPAALRDYAGYLLRRVFAQFGADTSDGPPAQDFVVLNALADRDAHSQLVLAEQLGINRTIMVKLVDRLQDAGYLTRTRNPENRRSYVLSLTDTGRAALDRMRAEVAARDARLTAALTKEERRRLDVLLGRLLPEPGHPAVASTEYLVAQASNRVRRLGDGMVAELGLRMRHYGPLSAIERLGPCPQHQLARHLAITEPAAAEIVDELVRAGLVERGQDPDDRRRYALELTDLGRERVPQLRAAAERMRGELRAMLGDDGEAELRVLLTKLLPDG